MVVLPWGLQGEDNPFSSFPQEDLVVVQVPFEEVQDEVHVAHRVVLQEVVDQIWVLHLQDLRPCDPFDQVVVVPLQVLDEALLVVVEVLLKKMAYHRKD